MTVKKNETTIVRAILIYIFFIIYSKFEKQLKDFCINKFLCMKSKEKNKLYFFLSGISFKRLTYKYQDAEFSLVHKYDENTIIEKMDLNQCIKYDKHEKIIAEFDANINSLQKKAEQLDFRSSCEKILMMRNILAHSLDKETFDDRKCVIELLSDDFLLKKMPSFKELDGYGTNSIDHAGKQMLSNIIYMKTIINRLEEYSNTGHTLVGEQIASSGS